MARVMRRSISSRHRVLGWLLIAFAALPSGALALPQLDGCNVLGLEFAQFGNSQPGAYLKLRDSTGKELYYPLSKPPRQNLNDMKRYEKALPYYGENKAEIQILPVTRYDDINCLSQIRSMQKRYESEIENAKREEQGANSGGVRIEIGDDSILELDQSSDLPDKKELSRLFKLLDGFDSRKISSPRWDSDTFSSKKHGGEYVKFKPSKSFASFTDYTYLCTPKKHLIYRFILQTKDNSNDQLERAKKIIERRYKTNMIPLCDGGYLVLGENGKGHRRALVLKIDEVATTLTLTDGLGWKQAEKEKSKYISHLRKIAEKKRLEEEARIRAEEEERRRIAEEAEAERRRIAEEQKKAEAAAKAARLAAVARAVENTVHFKTTSVMAEESKFDGGQNIFVQCYPCDDKWWYDVRKPFLNICRREGKTQVYLALPSMIPQNVNVRSGMTVKYRFDAGTAETERWSLSTDGTAVFSPSNSLISNMMSHRSLYMMVIPLNQPAIDCTFDLEEFQRVVRPFYEEFGVPLER